MIRMSMMLAAAAVVVGCTSISRRSEKMDLQGQWQFCLDKKDVGVKKAWFNKALDKTISLPGTTDEAGYGEKTVGSDDGILTRVYKYYGPAWYSREINVPAEWSGKDVEFFMERVMWKTTAWIDGKEVGSYDSLATPHVYNLGQLSPGKHRLTVRIDNSLIYNIGDKGHSYGDHMQTIWNGMVGRIEVRPLNALHIGSLRTYTDVGNSSLKVVTDLKGKADGSTISYQLKFGGSTVAEKTVSVSSGKIETVIPVKDLKTWNHISPNLYQLVATLTTPNGSETKTETVGFRKISHDGTHFLVNGIKTYMRGNLDNCHFPLTGYADMDAAGWQRILKIQKDYGLNHIRFHSWCPPEAAFIAADKLGMYLQPECGIWIDGWMKGRSQYKPDGLGKGPKEVDTYVENELNRILEAYGNHPSFVFCSIGNELGSSDFDLLNEWMAVAKKKDPRRLYSCSTARQIKSADDYVSTHWLPGVGGTRGLGGGKTNWDFEHVISKSKIPVIAHELGQWPVYPKWSEIDKYTGVLRARNYENFKKIAEKNGIVQFDEKFCKASGEFSRLLYKYEMETAMRTKSMAGYHLLGIQDYSGQGEALIGILDSFYDSKGIIGPEVMSRYCNDVVPLTRFPKFIYTNKEELKIEAEIANYSDKDISGNVYWKLRNAKGELLRRGKLSGSKFVMGEVTKAGTLTQSLESFTKAEQLNLVIGIEGTKYENDWRFWVFPDQKIDVPADVIYANELNDKVLQALEQGAKVVLTPEAVAKSRKYGFMPVYWSLGWFPGQQKAFGLCIEDKHPALAQFPTSYHSDWQWEAINNRPNAVILNDAPKGFTPIVQIVDGVHRNEKLGLVFEAKVGNGKLLVCGFDLTQNRPEVKQLRNSLLSYAGSDQFSPKESLSLDYVKAMFPVMKKANVVKGTSSKFKNAALHIKAGANYKPEGKAGQWSGAMDKLPVKKAGYKYKMKGAGLWREGKKACWFTSKGKLKIDCPQGIIGTLYVRFHDWSKNNRTGAVKFEGREFKLGKHEKGTWLQFHVMREDALDSKLILELEPLTGPNLHVTDVVLVPEE